MLTTRPGNCWCGDLHPTRFTALSAAPVRRDLLDAELLQGLSQLSGSLFAGELFGEGPVRVGALKDGVAVVVEAEGNAVSGDHGVQSAQIAEGIFGLDLEVSNQHLSGGVVLKADQSERGATALEPIVAAGIGLRSIMPKRGRGGSDIYGAGVPASKLV